MRMHRRKANAVVFALLAAAGIIAVPAPPAYANTQCVKGQNAGFSNGGSGEWFWGWCHPNGGYVNYRISMDCAYGDQGWWSNWASGSGNGAVYTNAFDCPSQVITDYVIDNG